MTDQEIFEAYKKRHPTAFFAVVYCGRLNHVFREGDYSLCGDVSRWHRAHTDMPEKPLCKRCVAIARQEIERKN